MKKQNWLEERQRFTEQPPDGELQEQQVAPWQALREPNEHSLVFSERWVLFVLLLAAVSVVLKYDDLLLTTVLMLTSALLAWVWNRLALIRIEYRREFSERRAFVGETVGVDVAVVNRKLLPVPWLRVADSFPDELPIAGQELEASGIPGRAFLNRLATLGPFERLHWSYEIDCVKRGFYFFGPTDLHAGDIFGFFARDQRVPTPGRLIIYPPVYPLPELGFPGKELFGNRKAPQPIFEDPSRTIGVREYHPEDAMKRVHWKATARQGDLQVKVYEPTIVQNVVVFLNVATFATPWFGVIPERQEQVISIAASIAYHAVGHRLAVGLIANGAIPHSDQSIKVLPSRAPDQLTHILEALAAITQYATTRIERLLAAESPRLPWGSTLVVVTSVVTDELLAEMARLRDAGRRLTLVSMDPNYTEEGPPGIVTYHLPVQALGAVATAEDMALAGSAAEGL